MKKKYIKLIIIILVFNQLFGNPLILGNQFVFKYDINYQDTVSNNNSEEGISLAKDNRTPKSPGKALLFSGILPGTGQLYMEKWFRGLFFVALDAIAIGTWYSNNNLAEEKKRDYSSYANEHWNFENWIHDYYKWEPNNAPDDFSQEEWDSVRKIFVNQSDSIAKCYEYPYCYTEIWNHSHSIEFTWGEEGEIISSSQSPENRNVFIDKYNELCGRNSHLNRRCDNDLEQIKTIMDQNSVFVIRDHHFFEGIQKYDMFFSGWDDNDSIKVEIKSHGDINATSPNQNKYRSLWSDYNRIKTLAGNGGKFMLINRVISMVDAVLLAKTWNNQNDIKLSLNAYPDISNKIGVGSIELSIYF